jgi:hypothetical protein
MLIILQHFSFALADGWEADSIVRGNPPPKTLLSAAAMVLWKNVTKRPKAEMLTS